ncbi:hypothetical protein KM043_012195 [Ampulex compressa]|nr:hypothetical protein KM043_012195 [Ampulex compressa]
MQIMSSEFELPSGPYLPTHVLHHLAGLAPRTGTCAGIFASTHAVAQECPENYTGQDRTRKARKRKYAKRSTSYPLYVSRFFVTRPATRASSSYRIFGTDGSDLVTMGFGPGRIVVYVPRYTGESEDFIRKMDTDLPHIHVSVGIDVCRECVDTIRRALREEMPGERAESLDGKTLRRKGIHRQTA